MRCKVCFRRMAYDLDVYQIFYQAGSAADVSYLIDFLPSYLFPAGDRAVKDWIVAGISLGGHSTWITLRHGRIFWTLPSETCLVFTASRSSSPHRRTDHWLPRLPPTH